jgi:endonuclease YncB( thermonuclease family)
VSDPSGRPRGAKILRFRPRWPQRPPKPPRQKPPLRAGERASLRRAAASIALLFTLALAGLASEAPPVARAMARIAIGQEEIAGVVREVIDGDSLVVGRTEIRLTDFSAPEWNEQGGTTAKLAMYGLAFGREVVCTPCEGTRVPFRCRSYDRILAKCRLNGVSLGELMRARYVREGGR